MGLVCGVREGREIQIALSIKAVSLVSLRGCLSTLVLPGAGFQLLRTDGKC